MNDQKMYVPSATPGMHWHLYTHKPQGRPAVAVAVEGELELNEAGHPSCFKTVWPGSRTMRIEIAAPATAKRKQMALEDLKAALKNAGSIQ